MANRIAFLSRLPQLEIFSKTLGIEYLNHRGFEVFFLDLSCLIDGSNAQHLYKDQAGITGCNCIAIQRLDELDAFVKENSQSTIFIDFVAGLSEFNLNIGRVFKVLKHYDAKYYVISNGAIPAGGHDTRRLIKSFYSKIIKLLKNPSLLINLVERKTIVSLIKLGCIYHKPRRIFGIEDSPIVVSYLKKYGMSVSEITPINSRDYDAYLEYMREAPEMLACSEICVFLDEDHTNHPDFFLLDIAPLNEAEYVKSMNNLFDYVEKKTGFPVVICAHPKSRFNVENHPYGNRAFIQGKTLQLVATSKMVIAHSSTSIGFPVLFNKPIVLVVTNEMKKRMDMLSAVKAFAKELGLTEIYTDETYEFDVELESYYDYENYLYKYVKNKESINKLIWEIVANSVIKD